jgi:YidC/Oxa1 family membrane protein insertase
MDNKRLILFVIFSFSILMLWESWQQKHVPQQVVETKADASVPDASKSELAKAADLPKETSFKLQSDKKILVQTDVFKVEIDTVGGDIRHLELVKHRAADSNDKNFVLMDSAAKPMLYVAQSGLIGSDLPNHKTIFTTEATQYQLADNQDSLEVKLSWQNEQGVKVDKIYTFHRARYAVDVSYQISNQSAQSIEPWVYYQIVHDNKSNQGSAMMPTFTGGAYYTEADKYKKVTFKDMAKTNLSKNTQDGWVGLVQHYFASAWIPKVGTAQEFYTKQLSDDVYAIGSKGSVGTIAAGATATTKAQLYAGPQTHSELIQTAPGLQYTVDYGWLTVIATPLFWVLSKIHQLVGNWGVAIILLTIMIKALFYPLSAKSYRSMAQMRELAPRLQAMKEKFGDDRQKMQQAMMELYKTEKINPMGGCLPILVQIPVFISLYWVLLGSVEMRHAPFILWIKDLSAVDPFYVLPLIMGATMIVQSKLNPKPADPVQAKVMTIMPVIFSVFFFFFPAGLVLYWVVNNILSIAQQWQINRTIHAEALAKKKGNAR